MCRTLSTTSGTYYIIVVFCEYIEIEKIAHAPVHVAGSRARACICISPFTVVLVWQWTVGGGCGGNLYCMSKGGNTSARALTYLTDHFFFFFNRLQRKYCTYNVVFSNSQWATRSAGTLLLYCKRNIHDIVLQIDYILFT